MSEILRAPPKRNPAQWAKENRILGVGTAEAGPFRPERTPYMTPIYEAVCRRGVKRLTVVLASQMGKTEFLLNCLGWGFSDDPAPALYVAPTEKLARSMATDRISKMFATVPAISKKIERKQQDKILEKMIGGVRFGIAWAGSEVELSSHPVCRVYLDEYSRMVANEGGDPLTLAEARTATYYNSIVLVVSSPGIEGICPTWREFLDGSRHIWSIPCVECGEYFSPRLSALTWDSEKSDETIRRNAFLTCPHCGAVNTEQHRWKQAEKGRFVPHLLTEAGELEPIEHEPDTTHLSFFVPGLASPWRRYGDAAVDAARAYRSGDNAKLQAVINTQFGEVWKIEGDAPTWNECTDLISPHDPKEVPRGTQLITMGVDVQSKGLYWVVYGWGYMSEAWLLDYGFTPGDTQFDNTWIAFQRQITQEYALKPISMVFVDSGYQTDRVYAFCRRNPGKAFAAKGHATQDVPLKFVYLDLDLGGAKIKRGIKLFHVNSDHFKSEVHARLRWPRGEPGEWHFHSKTDEAFLRQITAEQRSQKPSGRVEWIQIRKDNHYFDATYLALAAAYQMQVHSLGPITERAAPPQTSPVRQARPRPTTKRPSRWERKPLY